ncbi:MAG: hypothetical protein WC299_13710 [Kiritimatiellia bacterium]
MIRGMLLAGLAVVTVAAGAWAEDKLPVAKVETVSQPVRTARDNIQTLAPDAKGRWQFICQTMNYKGTYDYTDKGRKVPFTFDRRKVPGTERNYVVFNETDRRPDAEWVVLDLESGKLRVFDMPGFHFTTIGAVRADNGRVFFFGDFMQVYYYEPQDGEMKILGEIAPWIPARNENRSFYKTCLGPDGKAYATTQAYGGKTAVVQVDPDALTWKIITGVGVSRPSGLTYGYYMGLGLPWVYVAVGQDHWELMAVNIETGEKRCLAERKGPGARITVSDDGNGAVTAGLSGDGKSEKVWCIDGKMEPVKEGEKQPRAAAPNGKKLQDPPKAPELDKDRPLEIGGDGSATVWWRPADDKGEWRSAQFRIKRAEPEWIESLTALPDGSLLGNVRQYHGWFRYHPAQKRTEYFGHGGPSGPRTCILDGKAYYAGYPNCTMSVYDPARPWKIVDKNVPTDSKNNPALVGSFGQGVTESHFAKLLLPGPNGRIYLVGRRERWSTGTGLGYYDVATKKRIGLGQDMKEFHVQGAALLPKLNRLVLSGSGNGNQFFVYDLDLKVQEPIALKEGLPNTGQIQGIGHDSRILGLVGGETNDSLYLFDVEKKSVVLWKELEKPAVPVAADAKDSAGAAVAAVKSEPTEKQELEGSPDDGSWYIKFAKIRDPVAFQKPADGSWWMIRDKILSRLNPETLDLTPVARLSRSVDLPCWAGQDLYGIFGCEVVKVALPGK